jgi:NitT/TauT family transport system substrate-binding protein
MENLTPASKRFMLSKEDKMKTLVFMFQLVLIALLPACASSTPSVATTPATRVAATTAPTPTSSAQLEKVSLEYGSDIPLIMLMPFDVAQALDLYKQEGLDVAITHFCRSCVTYIMQQAPADFAGLGIDESLVALRGKRELQMVVAFTRFVDFQVLVRSDMQDKIKTFADLKGQKITYYDLPWLLPYLVAKAGLKPEDVQFIDGGETADMPAAMQRGEWVATSSTEPYATPLIKSGRAYALVDLTTEADSVKWVGGEFPDYGLVATTDTIKNRPQTVQKMTNALVKALRYIATHSAADIAAILPQDVTGNDKALFIDALQHDMSTFSKDGIATEAGVKNVVEINRALGKLLPDQQINIGTLYTNAFVNNVK